VDEAEAKMKQLREEVGGPAADEEAEALSSDGSSAAQEMLARKLEEDRERFEAELVRIVAEQERKKQQLQAQQEAERQRLEEEMAREGREYEEKLRAEQERRMEELKRKKEEIEKMLSADSDNLSQEERSKMIEQHESKLRQLEQDEQSKKAAMDRFAQSSLVRFLTRSGKDWGERWGAF
jgi:colicin import membrane protein